MTVQTPTTAPLLVTVCTPGYELLCAEAVRRIRAASGCDSVLVLDVPEGQGFAAKLALDELCPRRPIVFFDADWWALRSFDVREVMVQGDGFTAVHDPAVFDPAAWPAKDVAAFDLAPLSYVNTGFFACDLSSSDTRAMFSQARTLRSAMDKKFTDPTDQGCINVAVQDLGLPLRLLPTRYNFYWQALNWGVLPFVPRGVIGLHAFLTPKTCPPTSPDL